MSTPWAFIIGIDQYAEKAFGVVPYAEVAAKAVSESLTRLGLPARQQFLHVGPHATLARLKSALRKFRKRLPEQAELLLYFAGRTFSHQGKTYLAGWDSWTADLPGTSLPLAELVAEWQSRKPESIVVLLEAGSGGDWPRQLQPHWDKEQLAQLFGSTERLGCFTASEQFEPAFAAAAKQLPLWTSLLIDTLQANLTVADSEGQITARAFQELTETELPRLIRRHLEPGLEQWPELFCADPQGLVIARLDPEQTANRWTAAQLARVVFRQQSITKVKELSGFRKSFQLPNTASASSRKFIARTAVPDIKAELESVYDLSREEFGYHRKDLEMAAEDEGFGFLRSPDFEYTVAIELDEENPSQLHWRREVGRFADPNFVKSSGFAAVFGQRFDEMSFEFEKPIDVGDWIDRLDEHPPADARVRPNPDGTECEITLAGFTGQIILDRKTITIRGGPADPSGLLQLFLRFLGTFGPVGSTSSQGEAEPKTNPTSSPQKALPPRKRKS